MAWCSTPGRLVEEIKTLDEKGVKVTHDNLKIAENTILILPVHSQLDQLREKAAGKNKIGTTGRGIGPAYEDKVGRRAIRAMDLQSLDSLRPKIDKLLVHHNILRRGMGEPEVNGDELFDKVAAIAPQITPYIAPVWKTARRAEEERQAHLV